MTDGSGDVMVDLPHGMRLNNPMNIRISSNNWLGKITPSSDPDFETFATVGDGLHAGTKIVANYYRLRGLSSISEIINRYAPPGDNNPTVEYAAAVAKFCGVDPDDQIDVLNPLNLVNIIQAMCRQEQGGTFVTRDQITDAVQAVLAGSVSA